MKEIPLTQGKVALVDDSDFESASRFNWCYHKRFNSEYAIANVWIGGKRTTVELHRFILCPSKNTKVDHRDGNGLNCQRSNMRIASKAQNERNRKVQTNNVLGIKGVHRHGTLYCAQIKTDFGRIRLGSLTLEEAIAVYDSMAREFHGEFANTNR